MNPTYADCATAAAYIRGRLPAVPETALILGSGLGGYADALEGRAAIPYADIPGFPLSTVENHRGELVCGRAGGRPVLVLSGRFHYYEGYTMAQTAFPVRVFAALGIKSLIITNAAGGINRDYKPGDLVCVRDHIKLTSESPARGPNMPEFGARFFDMQSVYDKGYIAAAKAAASRLGIGLKEGVYAYMSGPQYETPAEIRMLGMLGADLVGMSTVAEVIAAAHCGIKVLCISCVTNYAAGITDEPLSHGEVVEAGEAASADFKRLVDEILGTM